ncbi:hypothetical protein EXIGLDRAFT_834893 [Exidia glandulosa HHB12029]|uniref:CCZ1/INTU/HSP4 first Longin domain-containing protein n=1 Tax=Exidia glandulosa HHB12029 TaxID=1314781 RepID=A0A165JAJ3_EXIGL|nr:hypothetical protein EXIGLDRAFT_834893 [Exidia glandulosa HHB12029]
MNRVAASLSYLVIYNATLTAPENTADDDEDAQENAQILFYTASERAVSRDRMLRQVGLARALVNFTETFAGGAMCENVHAQGKRLVMLQPEPDFWLHASVAVAKTPRPAPLKSKAGESSSSSPQSPPMQHHEHSVHDAALRAHLLRGYEDFKLLHGTFASILAQPNGRQTLERQLERFFTVWAWKWDVESSETLREHLGLPTHPQSKILSPLVEEYCSELPEGDCAVVVTSTNVIPNPSTSTAPLPHSLIRHLISLSPAPTPVAVPTRALQTRRSRLNSKPHNAAKGGTLGFLTNTLHMPSVSMGSMDMTKWNWSGYLTFGARGSTIAAASAEKTTTPDKAATAPPATTLPTTDSSTAPVVPSGLRVQVEAEVDSKSLLDALGDDPPSEAPADEEASDATPITLPDTNTDAASPESSSAAEPESDQHPSPAVAAPDPPLAVTTPALDTTVAEQPRIPDQQIVDSPIQTMLPPPPPQIEFSSFTAFLPASAQLVKRKVYFLSTDGFTAAVVRPLRTETPFERTDDSNVADLVPRTVKLLHDLRAAIDREPTQSQSPPPPTSKTLPTKHLLTLRDGTTMEGSSGFNLTSPYFFDCERTLDVDAESEEIFSRTTNPARWFVLHRGDGAVSGDGDRGDLLYLEDARKEASLIDVADEVATVRRRYAM